MNATTQADQDHPPPPLWRHGLAMLYDTLLVVPLFMAAAGLWVAILGPTDSLNDPAVPASLQRLSWLVILLLFFGIFWQRAGQTLGMQAWRIKLVTDSGDPPTWRQVRCACSARCYRLSVWEPAIGGVLYRHIGATGTIACRRHTGAATENALAQTGQGNQIRRDATIARCHPTNTPRWAPMRPLAGRNQI